MIVTASVILTILGSFAGVASFISRLKLRRAERRVYEAALTQIKAEDAAKSAEEAKEKAGKEVANLREEKNTLSLEIGKLPQEANRLYLIKQLETLASGLNSDFKEYVSIERQLHALEPVTTLDARVREAVEVAIVPVQKQRERRNTYVFLLLVFLLVVNLSPIPLNYLVERYFNVLGNSPNWTSDSPAWMIGFGSFAVVLLLLFASSLLRPRKPVHDHGS
jgi:hypothetical protein